MIGFIDLEANTNTRVRRKRSVFDIIDVSLISEIGE